MHGNAATTRFATMSGLVVELAGWNDDLVGGFSMVEVWLIMVNYGIYGVWDDQ